MANDGRPIPQGEPNGDTGADEFEYPSRSYTCPRCQGRAYRVPRRLVDRLISIFVPIRRYSCCSPRCGWVGNVRRKQYFGDIRDQGDERVYGLDSSRPGDAKPSEKEPK